MKALYKSRVEQLQMVRAGITPVLDAYKSPRQWRVDHRQTVNNSIDGVGGLLILLLIVN